MKPIKKGFLSTQSFLLVLFSLLLLISLTSCDDSDISELNSLLSEISSTLSDSSTSSSSGSVSQEPSISTDISAEPENITIENNEEFAALIATTSPGYDEIAAFADKYDGQIIEFAGSIDYIAIDPKHSTIADILLSAGPYSTTSQYGPTFKFDRVSVMFDFDILGDAPEYVNVGDNVYIIAKIDKFNADTGLFFLNPISIEY